MSPWQVSVLVSESLEILSDQKYVPTMSNVKIYVVTLMPKVQNQNWNTDLLGLCFVHA